jgi:hypothetical protein
VASTEGRREFSGYPSFQKQNTTHLQRRLRSRIPHYTPPSPAGRGGMPNVAAPRPLCPAVGRGTHPRAGIGRRRDLERVRRRPGEVASLGAPGGRALSPGGGHRPAGGPPLGDDVPGPGLPHRAQRGGLRRPGVLSRPVFPPGESSAFCSVG